MPKDMLTRAQEEEEQKGQGTQEACYLHPSELAERRVRLVVGMKRYFHGKRLEGLLSVKVRCPPSHRPGVSCLLQ